MIYPIFAQIISRIKIFILELEKRKSIYNQIIDTLQQELAAIDTIIRMLDRSIVDVVTLFLECKGRVVVAGIGKSAIVGQKIVATLNSTGTNAVFLHAADAIHGDLGMIGNDDVILILSKSGETPEIKVLTTLIKGFGNKIVGMVCEEKSYLGKSADHIILLPKIHEADPNDLAPTTSTTMQMVMGDALAIALLSERGFSKNDFAKFHPGGSIGRNLYLRVFDLISKYDKPSVYLTDTLEQIIIEISSKRMGATVVLDQQSEEVIGIITDGDLRRMLHSKRSIDGVIAKDIMTPSPKCIQSQSLVVEALQIIKKSNITQLVVLEGTKFAGLVHIHDIIKEGII